jgi:hypothetical protein
MKPVKEHALTALRHFRKWGGLTGMVCTTGLVRLANGSVERQSWKITSRTKEILLREPVAQQDLDRFSGIAFLEDNAPQFAVLKSREPVRGRTEHYCYFDDANFYLEEPDIEEMDECVDDD